jgi:hypothetical protein
VGAIRWYYIWDRNEGFMPSNQIWSNSYWCMNYAGNQTSLMLDMWGRTFARSKLQLDAKNQSVDALVDRPACETKSHMIMIYKAEYLPQCIARSCWICWIWLKCFVVEIETFIFKVNRHYPNEMQIMLLLSLLWQDLSIHTVNMIDLHGISITPATTRIEGWYVCLHPFQWCCEQD